MTQRLFKSIPIAATVMLGVFLITPSLRSQEKSGRNAWTWINADDSKKIEIKVENKVEFNEDYSDVAAIPADGALRVTDSRTARTFRLAITRDSAGELRRDYSVDQRSRSFDAEGQTWLRTVLLQAVREGGLDARTRAQRILKQRGVRGLTEEITYLKGDYVHRIYFEELLQAPGVSTQDLKTAIHNASNSIASDYDRAQMLVQIAPVFLGNKDLVADYFNATSRIKQDYEHARVLAGALKQTRLSKDVLIAIAQSAATIQSDYEKAGLLIKGAERYQGDLSSRMEWLHAVRTIGSDYEHHRVLSGALKPEAISIEALSDLVRSAARMKSDYEKASFLIEAMSLYRGDAQLRAAFVETARTIGSEYERGRVQKRFEKAAF
jgi:bla regulator protein blaR1